MQYNAYNEANKRFAAYRFTCYFTRIAISNNKGNLGYVYSYWPINLFIK